jgi:hypothetical protein
VTGNCHRNAHNPRYVRTAEGIGDARHPFFFDPFFLPALPSDFFCWAAAAGAVAVAVPGGHSHRHEFDGAAFIATSLADRRIFEALDLTPPAL